MTDATALMNDARTNHASMLSSEQTGDGIDVRVVGMVRGRELDSRARISLSGQNILLAWEHASPWQLSLDGLDGVMPRATQLTLYLSSGDVLELGDNDALRTFASSLLDRACTVPELTRGLRSMGSLRGSPGDQHDRWFAPLLAARRAVAGVSDAERQVALVDAAVIAQQLHRAMTDMAKELAPTHAPMQRALDAALQEESEPVFEALERLALAADVLRTSAMDTRLVDWRRWMNALREVFVAADQSWPRCAAVVRDGV